MHKYRNRIATALLPALLCISGQAFSAGNDVLKVTGKFMPGGCGITLTGNGEVNLGDINFAGLHPDGTLLSSQTVAMDIACPDPLMLRVALTDAVAETKIAYDDVRPQAWKHISANTPSRVFGLGAAGGKKIGAFQIEAPEINPVEFEGFGNTTGVLAAVNSSNKALWNANDRWLAGDDATIVGHSFTYVRNSDPLKVKTASVNLTIHPTINKTGELTREEAINLNGRVSFELFVL